MGEFLGADAVDAGQFGFGLGRGGSEGVEGLLGEEVVGGNFLRGGLFSAPSAQGFEEDGIGGAEVVSMAAAGVLFFRRDLGAGSTFSAAAERAARKSWALNPSAQSADAGELDARFGLGLFLGVQELAARAWLSSSQSASARESRMPSRSFSAK